MKRITRAFSITVPILLILIGFAFWPPLFRTPPTSRLPLPDSLISLESPEGQNLLTGDFKADYVPLIQNFEGQTKLAYCGVASSVIILNALQNPEPRWTQSTFFTDAASQVRSSQQVSLEGMTLEQLGKLLQAHGLAVDLFFADETNLETFRSVAQKNLETPGDFILVNYQRARLGQGQIGHISPLAAYNLETDRFLILDVADYKYPPVWVSAHALWEAMNTVDSSSGRTRGFLVARKIIK